MQYEKKPDGRPREFAEEEIDKMAKKLEAIILAASQEYRVTAKMLTKVIRLSAATKRFLEGLDTRDIYYRLVAGSLISPYLTAWKTHGRLTEDSRKTHERLTKDTRKTQ